MSASSNEILSGLFLLLSMAVGSTTVRAADAPAWMRAQVSAALPAYDEKTKAVVLFEETIFTVLPNGKMKKLQREAVRILRPDGAMYGIARFASYPEAVISSMHAWCIPASGKDYEVKEKDAMESAFYGVDDSLLITDVRTKTLRIPDATVGSIVGTEVEYDVRPDNLTDDWDLQDTVPVRQARYTLNLPSGWSYQSTWLNHREESPAASTNGRWTWSVDGVEAIREEKSMPPWRGIAGRMVVALIPPGGKDSGIKTWDQIGTWYTGLAAGRRDASPAIKQKVAELTASATTPLAKMQALASFVQKDIRYVAIELGIGGHQPHAAAEIFSHRYGDCKDNVTLLSSMLKEIGIESYYVVINTARGSITATTPPNLLFNHMVMAIQLPAGVESPSLRARINHPKLGPLLFFDPTDSLLPLGSLPGVLQANYGLLVTPSGGELIQLPQLPAESNGVSRTAKMILDENGTLHGEVEEVRVGDLGAEHRYALRAAARDTDKIKAIEAEAGAAFSTFQILKASVRNLQAPELPFEWHYSLEAARYAKAAGDLVLVRPRIIGSEAEGFLETKEARRHPIEFDGPERDTDVIEIALPPDYSLDELPPPVDVDDGFASYHSKSEFKNGTLRYMRTFEIKQLSVPVEKAGALKQLYRNIENDERNSAVFKQVSK
jgi:transglutaminase-like putative cysteine protease